jgi:hypothetical protein
VWHGGEGNRWKEPGGEAVKCHQMVKVAAVTRDVRGYCTIECGAADSCCLRKVFLWAGLSFRVLECL